MDDMDRAAAAGGFLLMVVAGVGASTIAWGLMGFFGSLCGLGAVIMILASTQPTEKK